MPELICDNPLCEREAAFIYKTPNGKDFFFCDVCGKAVLLLGDVILGNFYSFEAYLNTYAVTDRPHTCPQCKRRNVYVDNIEAGTGTAIEYQSYCPDCGQKFLTRYELAQAFIPEQWLRRNPAEKENLK